MDRKKGPKHFGMKAPIGVDKDSGLVHALTTTAANGSDISQTPELMRGQVCAVWSNAGYVSRKVPLSAFIREACSDSRPAAAALCSTSATFC